MRENLSEALSKNVITVHKVQCLSRKYFVKPVKVFFVVPVNNWAAESK